MTTQPLADKYYRRRVTRRIRLQRLRASWPFLLWLAVAGAATLLYFASPGVDSTFVVHGMVESDGISVSPVESARIRAIHVKEGQTVREGDPLVTMDDSLIAHGVSADIIDMIQIGTSFGDTHQDVLQAVSQRLDAMSAIEADIALCRQDWERERAELEALRKEQARRDQSRTAGVIDETIRSELLPTIANLDQAMREYPKRMETLERQLKDAEVYYRNIMNWLGAADGEVISDAIQRRLDENNVKDILATAQSQANLHRESYTIRAPRDGVVSAILLRTGDVGVAGLPIMRIVPENPTRVTGFLSETQAAGLREGMRVAVRPMARATSADAVAVLETLSPEIHVTSYTLSATGRPIPMRAQRAFFRLEGPHELLGGESVYLRDQESTPGVTAFFQRLGLRMDALARL